MLELACWRLGRVPLPNQCIFTLCIITLEETAKKRALQASRANRHQRKFANLAPFCSARICLLFMSIGDNLWSAFENISTWRSSVAFSRQDCSWVIGTGQHLHALWWRFWRCCGKLCAFHTALIILLGEGGLILALHLQYLLDFSAASPLLGSDDSMNFYHCPQLLCLEAACQHLPPTCVTPGPGSAKPHSSCCSAAQRLLCLSMKSAFTTGIFWEVLCNMLSHLGYKNMVNTL